MRLSHLQLRQRQERRAGSSPAALGTFAIVTFLATSRFSVNQFGYLGGGFRRYFLLPVPPGAVLRAAQLRVCMLLSAPLDPAGAVLGGRCSRPCHSIRADAGHAARERSHRPVRVSWPGPVGHALRPAARQL